MSKKTTIIDVAEKCGYSKSTVSLVLRDSPEIPLTTKNTVLRAMENLGYRQNRFAIGLRTRRSDLVGMIVQDHLNPFYAEIVHHIERGLRNHGIDLLVSSSNTDLETELQVIHRMSGMQLDGLIVSPLRYQKVKEMLHAIEQQGTRCVVAGYASPKISFDSVGIKKRDAAREAMHHLLQFGHRKIGFIWAAPSYQGIGGLNKIHLECLNAAGVKNGRKWVRTCGFRMEDAYECCVDLFRNKDRPTAVLAVNDICAMAVIRAARDCGLEVPRDLSVVGVDDCKLASYYSPSLTTIAQPIADYAERLCQLTVDGIFHQTKEASKKGLTAEPGNKRKGTTAREQKPRHESLQARLIVRESTGPVPQ